MTRAFQKLQYLKNAATLAITILTEDEAEECYGNIFSESFDKNHCKTCRNGIRNFLHMPGLKLFLQKHYVPFQNNYECHYEHKTGNDTFLMVAGYGAHPNKDADLRNLIKNNVDQEKDVGQL